MIFVTGPLFSGKEEAIKELLGWDDRTFAANGLRDAENLVKDREDLETLADELAQKQVVIASELGGGVVPVDREERRNREAAGRLAVLLARRADTVIRVFCGIPTVLKGELP